MGPPRAKRRSICWASAVPSRSAVAYLTIWSYWRAIRSQSIGRADSTLLSPGQVALSPAPGPYNRADPMFFSRGSSRKPSRYAKANPTIEAPWVSVYWRLISAEVRCRSRPSIMAATSDAEREVTWE